MNSTNSRHSTSSFNYDSAEMALFLFAVLSIVVGIYFRFLGLGKWCLTVDEFYSAQAVKNILDKGIPAFGNGGLYTRGILFQYITAVFVKIWGLSEGTLRKVSVFFNIMSMPALYLICHRIGGRKLAFVVLSIFSLSLWEIEFSRFFRMYTAFQCVFLYFIYFLIREISDAKVKNRVFLITLAILGFFTHEAALFMILLLFVPPLYQLTRHQKLNYLYLIISVVLFILFYLYTQIDFWHLNDPIPPLPGKIARGNSLPVYLPNVQLLKFLPESLSWLSLLALMIAVCLPWSAYIILKSNFTIEKKIYFIASLLSAILYKFSICFLLLPLSVFFGSITKEDLKEKNSIKLFSFIILFLLFWFFYAFSNLVLDHETLDAVRKSTKLLFLFPNLVESFFYFPAVIPRVMIICALAIILSLFFKLFSKHTGDYAILMFVSIYIIAFYSIIHPYYGGQTRYLFFMYPIALIIIAHSIIALLKFFHLSEKTLSLCCLAFLPIFLIYSDDFNLYHLINIDQKDVNFRQIYNKRLESHYYQRRDFKSPAEFVNAHKNKEDKVIIDVYPPSYYLNDFDYFYRDRRTGAYYRAISIKRGRKEIWHSKPLIRSLKQLTNIIFTSKNKIWFIQSHKKFKHYNKLNPKILKLFNQNEVYTSIDGRLRVIELDPAKISHTAMMVANQ